MCLCDGEVLALALVVQPNHLGLDLVANREGGQRRCAALVLGSIHNLCEMDATYNT